MTAFGKLGMLCLALAAIIGWTAQVAAGPLEDLIAGAKKEGAIEFYGPSTLTPQGAQALGAAFNKKYGLDIKLQFHPSGNMTKDTAKVVTHATAGVAPEWDLMVVTDAHHATLWLRKLHATFEYKKLGVDSKVIHYDNGAISFANQTALPAYNTKLVAAKDVPKKWDDLLDPKWKGGKLGVIHSTHLWARLAAGPWGEEKTTAFVKKLAAQQPTIGQPGDMYSRLQLGEVLVAAAIQDSQIHRAKKAGAPIDHAHAVEPVISPAYHAGVPKNAPHPNVGHLFAYFLMSSEAQELWEKYGGQSSAFVPGTETYKYLQGKQVVYMTQDHAKTVDRLGRVYGKILGFGR
jgi:iron(III) transport system substrate-binding protein